MSRLNIDPRWLTNDAIVVLCFTNPSRRDNELWTHFQFRRAAKELGFILTPSQAHSMLSRAKGRVDYTEQGQWFVTVAGAAFASHVRQEMARLLGAAVTAVTPT